MGGVNIGFKKFDVNDHIHLSGKPSIHCFIQLVLPLGLIRDLLPVNRSSAGGGLSLDWLFSFYSRMTFHSTEQKGPLYSRTGHPA